MTGPKCVRCARPTPDGYACVTCRDRILCDLLGDDSRDDRPGLVDTAPAARDIAQGQASGHGEGGASGKPESRLPLDLAVTAKLDAVQGEMTTWARHVAEERYSGPQGHAGEDPIVVAARYLAANVEWLRHRPEVEEAYAAIEACARVVRGIVRGPAAQRYLGPCGAELCASDYEGWTCRLTYGHDTRHTAGDGGVRNGATWMSYGEPKPPRTCDGDVYARDGGSTGRCRTCGAEVATAERQAWLDSVVREHNFRAASIAEAHGVNVNTIRTWHARGLLLPHGEDRLGRPLFNVGEVLDLFRDAAVRRAQRESVKARHADKNDLLDSV